MKVSGPIKKRHPRAAVWWGRVIEYSLPVAGFVIALEKALTRAWDMVPPWLLVGIIALAYHRMLEITWSWAWRNGQEETRRRLMPHVRIDASNVDELHEVLEVHGPSWRQHMDELSQIDVKATMRASGGRLDQDVG